MTALDPVMTCGAWVNEMLAKHIDGRRAAR